MSDAGISLETMAVNFQVNQSDTSAETPYYPGYELRAGKHTAVLGEPLISLGPQGRARCRNFVALGLGVTPAGVPHSYTVRLHFAELDAGARPGQRVFDVKLQQQTVLKDLDILREAGGPYTAVVKEFQGVAADKALTVEFVSAAQRPTATSAPILSGLEVRDETYTPPKATAAPNALGSESPDQPMPAAPAGVNVKWTCPSQEARVRGR